MCGIIGFFGADDAYCLMLEGLAKISHRGKDGWGYHDGMNLVHKKTFDLPYTGSKNVLAHNLHSIVGDVIQPLAFGDAILAANCEIYNWQELAKKHGIKARNDAELLLMLLVKNGISALQELRGVYAIALWAGGKLILARDILGERPLWYEHGKHFSFCSEKKALGPHAMELNPREILIYDLDSGKKDIIRRDFFPLKPEISDENQALQLLHDALNEAVKIRIPKKDFGLLFSGGLDSVLIAKILLDMGCSFTCYTAAASESSQDLLAAKHAAEKLGLRLKCRIVPEIEEYLKIIVPLIEDSNVVKAGVALPLFIASELAKQDGNKVIFSGSGADEIFAGYKRHRQADLQTLNKDCFSDVLKIYEKNCYRDDVVTMYNNLELRAPFLDTEVVSLGLRISPGLKIKTMEKYILRRLALKIGIPEDIAMRPKKAAQYGSGFDKTIEHLSGGKKSAFLAGFYHPANVKLGALVSGGKDSLYAAYIMKKQNYDISCFITMKSKNPASYMFHTPNIGLAALQARAAGIPCIVFGTCGEQEKELSDLKKAILSAKEKYAIEGIVTGALFSNYQRERVERICDGLGLKIFSPLWHMDQEQELRGLLKEGFDIVFSSVAAYGLDASWVGRKITLSDVERLVELNRQFGINIAGEGGEYESLVLDCPLFRKRLEIVKSEIVKEDENTARLVVKNARLVEKIASKNSLCSKQ